VKVEGGAQGGLVNGKCPLTMVPVGGWGCARRAGARAPLPAIAPFPPPSSASPGPAPHLHLEEPHRLQHHT
jgi:hypothetical protein